MWNDPKSKTIWILSWCHKQEINMVSHSKNLGTLKSVYTLSTLCIQGLWNMIGFCFQMWVPSPNTCPFPNPFGLKYFRSGTVNRLHLSPLIPYSLCWIHQIILEAPWARKLDHLYISCLLQHCFTGQAGWYNKHWAWDQHHQGWLSLQQHTWEKKAVCCSKRVATKPAVLNYQFIKICCGFWEKPIQFPEIWQVYSFF